MQYWECLFCHISGAQSSPIVTLFVGVVSEFVFHLFFTIQKETGDPVLVSSIDIEDILDEFDWNHLYAVYIRLGIEDKDIRNERLGTCVPRAQERKILHLWCNTKAERATRDRMIAAMKQVPECRASLNRLKDRWNNPGKYNGYIRGIGN